MFLFPVGSTEKGLPRVPSHPPRAVCYAYYEFVLPVTPVKGFFGSLQARLTTNNRSATYGKHRPHARSVYHYIGLNPHNNFPQLGKLVRATALHNRDEERNPVSVYPLPLFGAGPYFCFASYGSRHPPRYRSRLIRERVMIALRRFVLLLLLLLLLGTVGLPLEVFL